MRKPTVNRNYRSRAAVRTATPSLPWSYFLVIAICGFVLAMGFFLAARQHFSSMDVGIKNSKLREQLKALEAENRRLVLAREVSLSPEEIKKTARNLGFKETETDLLTIAPPQSPVGASKPAAIEIASSSKNPPTVKMTAYQKPVRTLSEPSGKESRHSQAQKGLENTVAKLR